MKEREWEITLGNAVDLTIDCMEDDERGPEQLVLIEDDEI